MHYFTSFRIYFRRAVCVRVCYLLSASIFFFLLLDRPKNQLEFFKCACTLIEYVMYFTFVLSHHQQQHHRAICHHHHLITINHIGIIIVLSFAALVSEPNAKQKNNTAITKPITFFVPFAALLAEMHSLWIAEQVLP